MVGEATAVTGGGVVHKAIDDATVTFRCPARTLDTQTVRTRSAFSFGGKGSEFPLACELEVSSPGHVPFRESFTVLCDRPSGTSCDRATLVIELARIGAPPPPALALASASASASSVPPAASAAPTSSGTWGMPGPASPRSPKAPNFL